MPFLVPPVYNFVTSNVKGSDVAYNSLTTGHDNVALGKSTLGLLTSGYSNIAIGNSALQHITTGSINTAIGIDALQSATTADNNIAIGSGALGGTTTGGSNIAIGALTGSQLTTGTNNILIGTATGIGGINNATGNVLIGDAINPTTLTNTVYIVNGAGNAYLYINNLGNTLLSGALTIHAGVMITTTFSFLNGAAASAGTLNNAPVAGNPTKWIPINDNGTTRYIPAW